MMLEKEGHLRRPVADDEIIDRARLVQQLVPPKPVKVLTHDGGMRLRAQTVGLKVVPFDRKYWKD